MPRNICLETRWLGHFGGFYVPGCYCIYTWFSLVHLTWIDDAMSEGGCQSQTMTLACVMLEPQRVLNRR